MTSFFADCPAGMRRGEFYGRDAETAFSVLIKEVNLRLVKHFLLAGESGSVACMAR
jgi:hypothetical protein